MAGSLIRRLPRPWASCGTLGGARVCGSVDRGRAGLAWAVTDKILLWTGLKGDLETAVPRVRGKRV